MNTEKYYVVEYCSEDNWEQISQSIDSYENAIKFKDSDFVKNRFPKAFIVSTVPSQLLKQRDEMREMLSVLFPMFTQLDSEFGIDNPKGNDWTENEIQTIQRISDFLIESTNP